MEKVDWLKIETWAWGLGTAIIGGSATALSAIQGSDWLGSPLNWTQISAVAISGGFWAAVAFFKQSPLPNINTTNTTTNK